MLKPRKKITKKEIKKDPLLESLYNAQQVYESNKNRIMGGGVAVLILAGILWIYTNHRTSVNEMADAEVGKALVAMETGDMDNARYLLGSVVDEYDGTRGSALAHYYLGQINYNRDEMDLARHHLQIYVDDKPLDLLYTSTYRMLSDLLYRENDLDEAINILRTGINGSPDDLSRQHLSLDLARLLIESDEESEALKLVGSILDGSDLPKDIKQKAEILSGRITG